MTLDEDHFEHGEDSRLHSAGNSATELAAVAAADPSSLRLKPDAVLKGTARATKVRTESSVNLFFSNSLREVAKHGVKPGEICLSAHFFCFRFLLSDGSWRDYQRSQQACQEGSERDQRWS